MIFKFIIIGIIYAIIVVALIIIYKDMKNGGKKKIRKRSFGLEITDPGDNKNLKKGVVIPIHGVLTIGRKENNMLILTDQYVSSYHAKIVYKNNQYYLEDLGSTNGTTCNGVKLKDKKMLIQGDEIAIGSSYFKVI
ncbi:MAG: FHA domain-containing protein [Bacillota bacterium]|nr:FHA domain-containing protein [Bacillota bacterium]